ncbi:MAG TPA: xanthine dehydrogenase family protein molybdopterin-binding subunit [Stellaceae bacterium]|nr:xanthine dehydrogenase family protein molybdopterin-binding subunit [Stellaceae bacterium]
MTTPKAESLLRVEDRRLVTGKSRFVDDVHLDRMAHAAFVRSPHAHAEIQAIDTAAAMQAGALAVLTSADLPFAAETLVVQRLHPSVRREMPNFLATDRVRHVGEPVAMVLAPDRYVAEDCAALVEVGYRVLEPVPSSEAALAPGAPQIHATWPGNVAAAFVHSVGDAAAAMAAAPRRVTRTFGYGRQTGLPLETRGCVAEYGAGRNTLTLWTSTQVHYAVRQNVALLLGIPEYDVRVVAEDVGGGFGSKSRAYLEEVLVAHASRVLGRPVKWIEDRLEHLQATTHSRGIDTTLELGCDAEGRILALKGRVVVDLGAYVFTSGIITAEVAASHAMGPYKVPNIAIEVVCAGTNRTPLATYRGAGQPEATFPLECLLDLMAQALGLSAAEIRRRNLVAPADLPHVVHTTYSGPCSIESGDFPQMLQRAVVASGYHERVETDAAGRAVAWGMALGLESTGFLNYESARVRVDARGNVQVHSGLTSHGQGQATTFAKVCARALGVEEARVAVHLGDTGLLPFGRGTFASRGAVTGGNAVHGAATKLRERALRLAGQLLQCDPATLAIEGGRIVRAGGEATALSLGDIARAVQPYGQLYDGATALEETFIFDTGNRLTFALSVHAARVAVERRTGEYQVVDYFVLHDAGVMLDETIVEGQIIGGVVDGIGGAMLSEILYDDAAQLLTGSMADYLVATAAEAPRVRHGHIATQPTTNPLGVRGVGEGGIIAVAPAIVNAVNRALGLGGDERLYRLPLRPESVLAAIDAAAGGAIATAPAAPHNRREP